MFIELIEEVSPDEVISVEEAEKVVWNSPPPVEARYRLVSGDDKKIDRNTWAKLEKQYWSADDLEEFDMFFALPGWRLFGNAPEVLRAAGYDVKVVTLKEQAEEQRRLLAAIEEEEEKERRQREEKRKQAEELLKKETAGLVKVGETVDFSDLFVKEQEIKPFGFWYWSGLDFLSVGCSRLTGEKMVVHGYGNAIDVYCDPKTAEELFRRTWEAYVEAYGGGELGVVRAGFSALVDVRFFANCHGAQASKWIVENMLDQFLPLLREKYVVYARPNIWNGFDTEQAQQVCRELGIPFKEDPERHGVFPAGQ